jgi:hypothetical protein
MATWVFKVEVDDEQVGEHADTIRQFMEGVLKLPATKRVESMVIDQNDDMADYLLWELFGGVEGS